MNTKLLPLVVVFILSCSDYGIPPTEEMLLEIPNEYVEIPNSPIDTKIRYFFEQDSNGAENNISLYFFTERDYPSGGFTIVSKLEKTAAKFAIHLEWIQAPEEGPGINFPASKVFRLGTLSKGIYAFDIHINGKTVLMKLLLGDSGIKTSIQPNNLISSR